MSPMLQMLFSNEDDGPKITLSYKDHVIFIYISILMSQLTFERINIITGEKTVSHISNEGYELEQAEVLMDRLLVVKLLENQGKIMVSDLSRKSPFNFKTVHLERSRQFEYTPRILNDSTLGWEAKGKLKFRIFQDYI